MSESQRPSPEVVAHEILEERFPKAKVMFLAGSVLRGEGTASSDLDIVVVHENVEVAYRDCFVHRGWPIEVFVHDPETLKYFFYEIDRKSGIPSLPSMVLEGKELPKPSPFSQSLKELAKKVIDAGPPELKEHELQKYRYGITDLCDDMRTPRNGAELVASAARLYQVLADFYLRSKGLWSASGKGIPRRLNKVDTRFALEFQDAFEEAFANKNAALILVLSEKILSPFGGFLFEGSRLDAPSGWRLK